jgi:hypothetical protein
LLNDKKETLASEIIIPITEKKSKSLENNKEIDYTKRKLISYLGNDTSLDNKLHQMNEIEKEIQKDLDN